MKNPIHRILTVALIGIFALNFNAKAQDFGEVFQAGPADAQTYLQSYIEPIMLSFNNGLGSGWYNTAKPHKLLGFDLTVSMNVANIPGEDKLWQFNDSDFQNLRLSSGSNQIPTAVGGPTATELFVRGNASIGNLQFTGGSDPFPAAEGFDTEDSPITGFPVPVVQLGIGLIKNTDLKIRFLPSIEADDLSFSMFGIGVMHDIKQWIPGLKLVPVDISAFIGHTSLKAEIDINEADVSGGVDYSAVGTAEFKASSTTIQVLASKKIAILTPYVGIGYNAASSSFKVNGTFTYDDVGNPLTDPEVFRDPIDLSFGGGSSPRVTIGTRIKLLVLTLHADYTIQKYNTLTLGAGISIR